MSSNRPHIDTPQIFNYCQTPHCTHGELVLAGRCTYPPIAPLHLNSDQIGTDAAQNQNPGALHPIKGIFPHSSTGTTESERNRGGIEHQRGFFWGCTTHPTKFCTMARRCRPSLPGGPDCSGPAPPIHCARRRRPPPPSSSLKGFERSWMSPRGGVNRRFKIITV